MLHLSDGDCYAYGRSDTLRRVPERWSRTRRAYGNTGSVVRKRCLAGRSPRWPTRWGSLYALLAEPGDAAHRQARLAVDQRAPDKQWWTGKPPASGAEFVGDHRHVGDLALAGGEDVDDPQADLLAGGLRGAGAGWQGTGVGAFQCEGDGRPR